MKEKYGQIKIRQNCVGEYKKSAEKSSSH